MESFAFCYFNMRSRRKPLDFCCLGCVMSTETQFLVLNETGHYLLTVLLLDKMKKSAADSGVEGRIMFTGSEAHRITYDGGINFDHLTDPSRYGIGIVCTIICSYMSCW